MSNICLVDGCGRKPLIGIAYCSWHRREQDRETPVESDADTLSMLQQRVEKLERENQRHWETVGWIIVGLVVGSVVGWFLFP